MPWLIVDQRDRAKLVAGVEGGVTMYTREQAKALRFPTQQAAFKWIAKDESRADGPVCVMRDGPDEDHPRRGIAGHYYRRRKS